jgi:hypothetical protein
VDEDHVRWYERCNRWGQVNVREIDPPTTDVAWWVDVFRRTRVDAVTVNAGGIIAYYPTKIPGHWTSRWLGDRDLFGEFVAAARESGLHVLARMDCAGVHRDLAYCHPDWLLMDREGQPYRYQDVELYYTCPNGPYYREYMPEVFREILQGYDVEGFFDNGWPSLGRRQAICHCLHCQRGFRRSIGEALPDREDWDSPVFRQWVAWRYRVMEEVWDLFNKAVEAAKPGAVWIGNLYGHDFAAAPNRGVDWLNLARKSGIFGIDHQGRGLSQPTFSAGEFGRLLRNVAENKPFYNLYGTWHAHTPVKRTLSKTPAEATLWLAESTAAGFLPWWHSIGAANEDRRWVPAFEEFFRWHAENDRYLTDRQSLAEVGVVFSVQTTDYYGKEAPDERVSSHLHGTVYSLLKARIPFDIVHERKLDADSLSQYRVLMLPNVAALSDEQCADIRAFVERGGSLVATFESTLYDEWGQARDDYGLADVLGVHKSGLPTRELSDEFSVLDRGGPAVGHAFQLIRDPTHPILSWAGDTDYLAYEGKLCPIATEPDTRVLATLIPPYPMYPPEMTFSEHRETSAPTIVVRERGDSKIVYFPGDVDREFWKHNLTELGRALGEAARWTLGTSAAVAVEGPGLLDIHPYRKGGDRIVHLVNLSQEGLWRAPMDEITPLPGQRLRIRVGPDDHVQGVRLLVSGRQAEWSVDEREVVVTVPTIEAHEVVVLIGR